MPEVLLKIANWILSMNQWGVTDWTAFIAAVFAFIAGVYKIVKAFGGGAKNVVKGVKADRGSTVINNQS